MLRSGYSSESVLQEIAERKVVDLLDPTLKKTLLAAGASPRLISVLEEGEYRVDDATAEQARQAAAEMSSRQEAQAEKVFRDATAALKEQRARASATLPPPGVAIISALQDKLVACHDGVIRPIDRGLEENKKLIAFYFSAHWCAPCRKFTPQLVDYYNRVAPQHPEFELIFVSADRSRFNWETYIRETKMPWPAIDYEQLAGLDGLKQAGGESIPSLLVLDESGHVVASSYEGERYVGPQNAIAGLDKIFAAKGGN